MPASPHYHQRTWKAWYDSESAKRNRWDHYFLEMALHCASLSKDPNTRVGAVIIGADRAIRSTGYNGFPRGIEDTIPRLHDREAKLKLMVHAELNAIINAARNGVAIEGCSLYLAATDDSGIVWGGPPCIRCTTHVIQAGILRVISYPAKTPSKWAEELKEAGELLEEANVEHVMLPWNR